MPLTACLPLCSPASLGILHAFSLPSSATLNPTDTALAVRTLALAHPTRDTSLQEVIPRMEHGHGVCAPPANPVMRQPRSTFTHSLASTGRLTTPVVTWTRDSAVPIPASPAGKRKCTIQCIDREAWQSIPPHWRCARTSRASSMPHRDRDACQDPWRWAVRARRKWRTGRKA